MNKKTILWMILDLILIVVFNIVFFLLSGAKHPVSVWISYGFIHFSYIMVIITPLLVRNTTNTIVLGFPLLYLSSLYFAIVFVLGIVIIILHPENYKAALVIQIIITGLYAILFISNMITNENTADNIERHEVGLLYVKDASARLKGLMDSINDKDLYRKVEKIYDLIHASPLKSNDTVKEYEHNVLDQIRILKERLDKGDIAAVEETITAIEQNASERNRRLKVTGSNG